MPNWQDDIKDQTELRVFRSLADPNWDWRSLGGLETETGLNRSEILNVVYKYPQYVRASQSESKGPVFQLRDRSPSGRSIRERTLDSLTFSRPKRLK